MDFSKLLYSLTTFETLEKKVMRKAKPGALLEKGAGYFFYSFS